MAYAGFLSYSHAGDGLLAPRLQAGLQRFAKPWWKRRALRVFRDESGLSASPHLWSSIEEALGQSRWLVLLASPESAASTWVGKEIEWWLANRDVAHILPVVTDGDLVWSSDGLDVEASTAVHPTLAAVLADEPRWVDLRWARTSDDLDLRNPTFRDAVADVAAPLHGLDKDELNSEEVRQHRRTVRTVWGAGLALILLAAAAVIGGLIALGQRNRADQSADRAQQAALVSRAIAEAPDRPSLGLLLAVEASMREPSPESDRALLAALQAAGDRVGFISETRYREAGPLPCAHDAGSGRIHSVDVDFPFGDLAGDRRHALIDGATRSATFFDAPFGCGQVVAPDGTRVIVAPEILEPGEPEFIVDIESGTRLVELPQGLWQAQWVTDELLLARAVDIAPQPGPPGPSEAVTWHWVDATTGTDMGVAPFAERSVHGSPAGDRFVVERDVDFDGTGEPPPSFSRALLVDERGNEIADLQTGDIDSVVWTDDGSRFVVAHVPNEGLWDARVFDVDDGSLLATIPVERETQVGGFIVALGPEDTVAIADSSRGLRRHRLDGTPIGTRTELPQIGVAMSFASESDLLVQLEDGTAEVLRFGAAGPSSEVVQCCPGLGIFPEPDERAIYFDEFTRVGRYDLDTGEITYEDQTLDETGFPVSTAWHTGDEKAVLPNGFAGGLLLQRNDDSEAFLDLFEGTGVDPSAFGLWGEPADDVVPVAVYSHSGTGFRYLQFDLSDDGRVVSDASVDTGERVWGFRSVDRDGLTLTTDNGLWLTYDADGQLLEELDLSDQPIDYVVSLGGQSRRFVVGRQGGPMSVVDVDTGIRHDLELRGGAIEPLLVNGGERFVVGDDRGALRLYDTTTLAEVGVLTVLPQDQGTFPKPNATGEEFWVGAGSVTVNYTLRRDDWRRLACERAGRVLTEREWEQFVPGNETYRDVCNEVLGSAG